MKLYTQIGFVFMAILGWVANLASMLLPSFEIASFLGMGRLIGVVFPPLGIVLGWLF